MKFVHQTFFDGLYMGNGIFSGGSLNTKQSVSGIYCNPTKLFNTEVTTFDPSQFPSLNYFVENAANRVFKFDFYDNNKIELETKVFINEDNDGKDHSIVEQKNNNVYSWGFKAEPRACYLLETIIKLPKSLAKYESIHSKIAVGPIQGDFERSFKLGQFQLKSASSNITLNNLQATNFNVRLNNGDIALTNQNSGLINVKVDNGHLNLENVEADELSIKLVNGQTKLNKVKAPKFTHSGANTSLKGNLANAKSISVITSTGATDLEIVSIKDVQSEGLSINSESTVGKQSYVVDKSFEGKFDLGLLIGQVNVQSTSNDLHFTQNLRGAKKGYKGDNDKSDSLIKLKSTMATLNLQFQ